MDWTLTVLCAVCGLPLDEDEPKVQPYPPNGDWVHDDGEEGCAGRYWSAPGGDIETRDDGEWR